MPVRPPPEHFCWPQIGESQTVLQYYREKTIRLRLHSLISPQIWVYQSMISLSVKFAKSGPSLDPKLTSSLGLLTRQKKSSFRDHILW